MIVTVFRGYKYAISMQYLRMLVRKLDKDRFAEDPQVMDIKQKIEFIVFLYFATDGKVQTTDDLE